MALRATILRFAHAAGQYLYRPSQLFRNHLPFKRAGDFGYNNKRFVDRLDDQRLLVLDLLRAGAVMIPCIAPVMVAFYLAPERPS